MREYKSNDDERWYSKVRRDALRAAQLCINGSLTPDNPKRSRIQHGPVVKAGKCARCLEVWKRTHS